MAIFFHITSICTKIHMHLFYNQNVIIIKCYAVPFHQFIRPSYSQCHIKLESE
uniref:PRO2543 n=2 Tax=Homininae TaxID=207598 RepID=Q9P162_HUMAN|nr:PRO2543 [Homo sapiens]